MDLTFYRDAVTQHGAGATVYHAAFRAMNRVASVAMWNALVLTRDKLDRGFVDRTILFDRYVGRLLDPAGIRYATRPGDARLSERFLNAAAAKGDLCYAFFDGDELASYTWYSSRPTRLTELSDALELRFDSSYLYVYNGFTHPRHRGNRLQALGMVMVLRQVAESRCRGFVSYVDSANLAPLKSCARMGYEVFGRVALMKVGRGYVCASSPGCKQYDFKVAKVMS